MLPLSFQKPPPIRKTGNVLLDLLTPEERQRLLPNSESIPLPLKAILTPQGAVIEYCYFPTAGMISMTAEMQGGDSVEVGLAGKEGFVGVPIVLGNDCSEFCANVQVAGNAIRVAAAELRTAIGAHPAFRDCLLLHANVQFSVVTQCSACNALHSAEQRLARWLLMVHDRIDTNDLPLTHELLAQMLGTRRATVTFVAGALERAGLIIQTRGSIHILNAANLQKAACECYARIRRMDPDLLSTEADTDRLARA